MIVYYNDCWKTNDISLRNATDLKTSNPSKIITLIDLNNPNITKKVAIGDVRFEWEHRC